MPKSFRTPPWSPAPPSWSRPRFRILLAFPAFSGVSMLAGVTFLGVLQGLTEFLPVSSSGHLSAFRLLAMFKMPTLRVWGVFGDLTLHLGTLIAAVLFFAPDLRQEAQAWRDPVGDPRRTTRRSFWWGVVVATGLSGGLGFLFHDRVERAFDSLPAVIAGFAVTGVVLTVFGRRFGNGRERGARSGTRLGVVVGLAQTLAIWPGVSRSGMTIVAAMAAGLTPLQAFRFSFYTGIPLMAAAWLYDLLFHMSPDVGALPWTVYGWAAVTAGVTGWFALRWLQRWTVSGKLHRFGWYCLALGLVLLGVLAVR